LLQALGHLLGLPALTSFGVATGASPAPAGLASSTGLESASTPRFLEWQEASGPRRSIRLTETACAGILGPPARRVMYRAALGCDGVAADASTRAMRKAVALRSLCGPAPLLRELGFAPGQVERIRLRAEDRPVHVTSGPGHTVDLTCEP
jgi:hypothetical protein